jgi:eukaryotic-like serine/threonine-protein kinase
VSSSPVLLPEPSLPPTIGRYEVVRLLGEGAMGRVLLARDPVLERDVAVKHLREDLKIPREVRQGLLVRMRHEARAAARVAHPNLVVIHDMGEDAAIGLYLVFEYVAGPTLKQRIAKDRLLSHEVARLGAELGAALTVAHEAGVLHRDIKPENLILARWGGKIADFGIARIPDSTLTHQGGLMGTPAYSAPETFRSGKFSPASDQFSLAASLYEALSGRRAFPGDDAVAVAAKIASDPPEPFARSLALPQAVDDVLARALSRKAEERFPTCAAFGEALAAGLRQVSPRLAVDSTQRSASEPERRDDGPGAMLRDGTAAGWAAAIPTSGAEASSSERAPSSSASNATTRKRRRPEPISESLHERKIGQVILGAIVIVATAALLIRTALRAAESTTDAAPLSSATPSATASISPVRPRPTAAPPRHPRTEVSSGRPSPSAADVRPDAGQGTPAPSASASAASAASATSAASAASAASATSPSEDPPPSNGGP